MTTANVTTATDGLWEVPLVELANARFLGEGRLGLILVASLLLLVNPAWAHAWIIAVLLLYAVYAVVQLRLLRSGRPGNLVRFAHWVDAGCYCVVIELAGGLAGSLSIFLLFPVLVASCQSGLGSGVAVALVCTLWLVALGALQTQLHPALMFDEFSLVSATFLILVAFVIARWGHSEVTLVRRLALATDLNRIFTSRYTLDYALCELGKTLRAFQRADACLLVVKDTRSTSWLLYEVHSDNAAGPVRARRIGLELVQPLLGAPPDQAVVYRQRGFFSRRAVCRAYDWTTLDSRPADEPALTGLANLLGTSCFISLPLRSRCEIIGRVHLASRRQTYTSRDVRTLAHIVGQAALMIENMQLVERLAQEAATEERKRISRDLHDSTIQPYIGLKLGLEALRRKCAPDDALGHDLDDLLRMAGDTISDLRSYMVRLKSGPQRDRRISLLPAVRRQAEKFSEFYGISAQLVSDGDVLVNVRVFEEIMHIVREGLYNVRRHTCAESAIINLRMTDGHLLLEIVNDHFVRGNGSPEFYPRSIGERAKELGGRVRVEERAGGCTAVAVDIPL